MKLDALDHPKTFDFAGRLNVSRPTAIGHLELFWHFVAKHAPRGNIGKFPDTAIARACDWTGEPESFLQALLKSGLIDESRAHRFLVHDWPEHCPNWVRAQLQKLKTPFLSNTDPTEEPTEEASTRARVSKGSQGKGREAMPRESGAAPVDNGDNFSTTSGGKQRSGPDLTGQSDRPEDPPSLRNGSAYRRNGDFERINDGVRQLLETGVYTIDKPAALAQALHVSVHQVEVAIRQLRDRGRLPAVAA